MIGPMIGAIMMPIPQTDIDRAWREGGLISSIAVCERGPINAPITPWIKRKRTISSKFVEAPQAIDARTKPATAIRNKLRDPMQSESQPVMGVATAKIDYVVLNAMAAD